MKKLRFAAMLLLALLLLPVSARADALAPGQKPPRNEASEAFVKLYADDITGWDSAYDDAVRSADKLVLWRYPGSGQVTGSVEGWYSGDQDPAEVFDTCYTDAEGRFWGYVSYIYGERLNWVCLSDLGSEALPADPAVVAAVEKQTKMTAVQETTPVVVLVLVVVAGTGALLYVFRRGKKNAK